MKTSIKGNQPPHTVHLFRLVAALAFIAAALGLPGHAMAQEQDSAQFRYIKELPRSKNTPLTAMDAEGNLYVLGMGLNNATLDGKYVFDRWGDTTLAWELGWSYDNNGYVAIDSIYPNSMIYLIKLDTAGQMVWSKVATSFRSLYYDNEAICAPQGLVIRDSTVSIGFSYWMEAIRPGYKPVGGPWFFLFDTLFRDTTRFWNYDYPFGRGPVNFFVDFDLEGNRKEFHSLLIADRYEYEPHAVENGVGLCCNGLSFPSFRFTVDSKGNRHLFCTLENAWFTQLNGRDFSSIPPVAVLDNDTAHPYDLGFGSRYGTWEHQTCINVYMKMDTNWHIVKHKMMVDRMTGADIDTANERGRLISLHINNVTMDENDEIYLGGALRAAFWDTGQVVYPFYLFLDSTHYFRAENWREAFAEMPVHGAAVLIKYDTAGNVLWCNQWYHSYYNVRTEISDPSNIYLDSGLVLVASRRDFWDEYYRSFHYYDTVFFDSTHSSYLRVLSWPDSADYYYLNGTRVSDAKNAMFYAAYSQQTGEFVHYCYLDTVNRTYSYYRTFAPRLFAATVLVFSHNADNNTISSFNTVYGFHPGSCSSTDKRLLTYGTCGQPHAIWSHPNGLLFRQYATEGLDGAGNHDYNHNYSLYGDGFNVSGHYYSSTTHETFPYFILCHYVPDLDQRRQVIEADCPAVDSLAVVRCAGRNATLAWTHNPSHTRWQLEHSADSTDWERAAVVEVGDTSCTLTIAECRWFRVRGLCEGGEYGPWSDTVQACPEQGIDPVATPTLTLVPNPTSGLVTVVDGLSGLPADDVREIELLSPLGHSVLKVENTNHINASALPAGTYIARILTHQGLATLKLVVR